MPNKEIITQFHEILNVNLNWLFSGKGEPYFDGQDYKGEQAADPD